MGYIDSINSSDFNSNSDYLIAGENRIINCSTDANVQAKTATVPKGYTLDSNIAFLIKFTNGNTHATPTLNLTPEGGTALGAKNLVGNAKKLNNNNIIIDANDNTLLANVIYMCYYDGTKFIIDNNCTYHVGNSSNPHNITKTQLGLGSVEDRSTDTKVIPNSENYVTSGAVAQALRPLICETSDNNSVKEVSLSNITKREGTVIRVLFTKGIDLGMPSLLLKDISSDISYPMVYVGQETPSSARGWSSGLPQLREYGTLDLMWVDVEPSHPDPDKLYMYWRIL